LREIATIVTHYFQRKSPLINHSACRDYSTKLIVVWPTSSQQWAVSACLLCSYSQLHKHVSRLAASAINDDRHCQSRRDQR